jgi:hypothetical protein
VRAKRFLNNRLGFAIQLCSLRHSGRPLEPLGVPPTAMLSFVAMMHADQRVSLPRRGQLTGSPVCYLRDARFIVDQAPKGRSWPDNCRVSGEC